MTDELRPCPFCGEDAAIVQHFITGVANHLNYFGRCTHCTIRTRDRRTKEGAIADWNCRPIESALEAQVKELQVELQETNHGFEIQRSSSIASEKRLSDMRSRLKEAYKKIFDAAPDMENNVDYRNGVRGGINWAMRILRDMFPEELKEE
jgi:Lar family restriction alleviation protein